MTYTKLRCNGSYTNQINYFATFKGRTIYKYKALKKVILHFQNISINVVKIMKFLNSKIDH